MKHHGETFSLANGVAIPCLGFGTWQMKEGPETVAAIQKALELGYRHIDTAAYYQNERSVGQAVRASGLPREAVFVTSKVWNTDRGYESTLRAFDRTMEKLGLDYLDLYLIHWPAAANRFDNWEDINGQTWRAMTELYQQGRVRAIGVSNFLPHHLEPLLKTEVAPMVTRWSATPAVSRSKPWPTAGTMASWWRRGVPWDRAVCWRMRPCRPWESSMGSPPRRSACAGAWSRGSCLCPSR